MKNMRQTPVLSGHLWSIMIVLAGILVCIFAGFAVHDAVHGANPLDDMASSMEAALSGWKLTPAQAARLESRLAIDPDNITVRETLLGYYFHYQEKPSVQPSQLHSVLWLIRNEPDCYIAGTPYGEIAKDGNAANYEVARQAWLATATLHAHDSRLLDHAGLYCIIWDRHDALALLSRAHALAPDDPEIADNLKEA